LLVRRPTPRKHFVNIRRQLSDILLTDRHTRAHRQSENITVANLGEANKLTIHIEHQLERHHLTNKKLS